MRSSHTSHIFITVHNSSCGKVMFSHLSVILCTGKGCAWQGGMCVCGGGHVGGMWGAFVVGEYAWCGGHA